MLVVPNLPKKVHYLQSFSYELVTTLCAKTTSEQFVGGRKGYDKEKLFFWLLVKKVMNWDYRTVAEMAGVSHPTLIRASNLFLKKKIYEKVFTDLIKQAQRKDLIKGTYVALDSSFVHTFSKKGELGSENWNEHKKGYGFKLHLLIDIESKFPLALIPGNGIAHDSTLAVALLKKARVCLRKTQYVLGDKGYDSADIVKWITTELQAKAGIPIKKVARGKNYSWEASTRNFWEKAKGRTLKKSIYNRRGAIERVFSVLKRTYHLGKEETRGILNFAKNCYLSLISYMFKLFYIANLT